MKWAEATVAGLNGGGTWFFATVGGYMAVVTERPSRDRPWLWWVVGRSGDVWGRVMMTAPARSADDAKADAEAKIENLIRGDA